MRRAAPVETEKVATTTTTETSRTATGRTASETATGNAGETATATAEVSEASASRAPRAGTGPGVGTGSHHEGRSRLLLPTFHDGESIRSYTLSFTMEAEACALPKPQWRSKYFSLLSGSAKTVAYMFLVQNPVSSFEDLKAHLENQLERSQDRTARLALWSINRKNGEDLLEFASRVRAGTLAAYGTEYNANQIDDKALDVYLRALGGEVGRRTREMFPTSYSSAVDVSRNFETLGLSTTDMNTVGAVNRYQGRDREQGKKFEKKFEKKEMVCWYCQKSGHKKQDCWTLHPEKAPSGKRGKRKEGDRPTEENQ